MNIGLVLNSRSFSPHAISLLSLPGADMQSAPVQSPELQKQMIGTFASLSCRLKEKSEVYLHWYKQLPGERPKRILYQTGGTPVFDDSSDRNRFEVRNDPTQSVYGLTINSLTVRDSGVYYCAYWFYHSISWAKISLTKRLFVL